MFGVRNWHRDFYLLPWGVLFTVRGLDLPLRILGIAFSYVHGLRHTLFLLILILDYFG